MSTTSVGRLVARLELAGDFTERMMEASKALSSFSRRLKTLQKNAAGLGSSGEEFGNAIAAGAKKAQTAVESISDSAEKTGEELGGAVVAGAKKAQTAVETVAKSAEETRGKIELIDKSAKSDNMRQMVVEAMNVALAMAEIERSKPAQSIKAVIDSAQSAGNAVRHLNRAYFDLEETTDRSVGSQRNFAQAFEAAASETKVAGEYYEFASEAQDKMARETNVSVSAINRAKAALERIAQSAGQSIPALAKLSSIAAKLGVVLGFISPAAGVAVTGLSLGVRATAALYTGMQKLKEAIKQIPSLLKRLVMGIVEFARKAKAAFLAAVSAANKLLAPIKKAMLALRSLGRTVSDLFQKFLRFTLVLSGVAVFGSVTAFAIRGLVTRLKQGVESLDELGRGAASLQFVQNSFRALAGTFNKEGAEMIATAKRFIPAFFDLSSVMESGSAAMLKALQKASFGMASNMELMEQYNLAAQLLGSELANRFPEALRLLTKQSLATGKDLESSMDSFISGVGRLSLRFLDNIGVTMSLEEEYEKYAATIDKTADQLTEAERRTAAFNATILRLEQNMANIPDPTGTAIQVFGMFDATVQNLKDSLGSDLLPGLVELKMSFIEMAPTIEKFLQGFAGAFRGLIPVVREVIKVVARMFGVDFDALAKDSEKYGENVVIQFAQGMINAIGAVLRALITLGNFVRNLLKPGSPPKLLPELDDWGTGAAEAWAEGWTRLSMNKFKGLAKTVEQFLRAVVKDNAAEAVLSMRNTMARLLKEGKEVISSLPPAVRTWATAFLEVQAAMEETARAQDRLNETTARYQRLLKPIERELGVIEDRRFAVAKLMRAAELQRIANDEDAPELARQLALMELREIQLELNQRQTENARDAEIEAAEEALSEAEKQQKAAEMRLEFEQDILETLIENLRLMREIADAAKTAGGAEDAPALEEMTGALGLPIGSFETSVSDLSTLIEEMFTEQLGPLTETLSQVWGDVINGVINNEDLWANVRSNLAVKAMELWEWIKLQWAIYSPIVWEWLKTNIPIYAQQAWDVIYPWMSGWINRFWTWIQEQWAIYAPQVWAWLETNIPIWVERAWGAAKTAMVNWWNSNIPPLIDEWKASLIAKLMEWISPITQPFTDMGTSISTAWETTKTIVTEIFRGMFQAMGWDMDNFTDVWRSFGTRLRVIANMAWARIVLKLGLFFAKMKNKWNRFKTQVLEIVQHIWDEKMEGARVFVEMILGLFGGENIAKMVTAGKDFFEGLGEGIMEAASSIVEQVMGWIDGLLGAIEEKLGIESPSKVMRDLGHMVGKGFALGLDDSGKMIRGAVDGMMNQGFGVDLMLGAGNMVASIPSEGLGPGLAQSSRPIVVNVDRMSGDEADLHKLAARVGRAVRTAR